MRGFEVNFLRFYGERGCVFLFFRRERVVVFGIIEVVMWFMVIGKVIDVV